MTKAVANWYERVLTKDGVPNWTCGHRHRTVKTAYECRRPTPFKDDLILRWSFGIVPPLDPRVVAMHHGLAWPLKFDDEEQIATSRYISKSAPMDVYDRRARDEVIDTFVQMLDRARTYAKSKGVHTVQWRFDVDLPVKTSFTAAQQDELRREIADASKQLDRESPARMIEV